MRPKTGLLLALLLTALVFVSCSPPAGTVPAALPTATETPSEALLQDAGIYAKQEGVSLDEAVRRFGLMDLAGPLGAALEKNESATLAGHWIEHKPEFRIVIVFTRDGDQTIRKYVDETSPLWPVLEVRNQGDKPTEAQLQAEQRELGELLDKLGLPCDSAGYPEKGIVEVYVGDKKLFDETLAKAGATLPPHVVPVVVYEPLSGPPPFPVNPDPSIHFPQVKMRGWGDMAILVVGALTVRNGYLYVGDSLVVWKTDYFVNSDNGTIEILDREGKVVAREGEEVVMGGGGIPLDDRLNRMLKEPLPAGIAESVLLQGDGPRLSLNFNSDLFHMDAIPADNSTFYFLKAKPALDQAITQKTTVTGKLTTGTAQYPLRCPSIMAVSADGSNGADRYTTYWPADYVGCISGGVFTVTDGRGNIVARDGDTLTIEGRVLNTFDKTAQQLFDELPGGLGLPHLIVDQVVR